MVATVHQLSGCEFGQTLGDSEGQGSLACCSLWGHKELDMPYQLNNNSGSILQVKIKNAGTSLPSQLFMVGSTDPKGTTFQKTAELLD